MVLAMKPSKYKAIRTTVDGVTFASKKEARRDAELHLLQRAGLITRLERQPRFPLIVNYETIGTYVADWSYYEPRTKNMEIYRKSGRVAEDAKGVQTPLFKLKWKIVKALYPDIDWRLS